MPRHERPRVVPVRRGAPAVEQARGGEREGARRDGGEPCAPLVGGDQRVDRRPAAGPRGPGTGSRGRRRCRPTRARRGRGRRGTRGRRRRSRARRRAAHPHLVRHARAGGEHLRRDADIERLRTLEHEDGDAVVALRRPCDLPMRGAIIVLRKDTARSRRAPSSAGAGNRVAMPDHPFGGRGIAAASASVRSRDTGHGPCRPTAGDRRRRDDRDAGADWGAASAPLVAAPRHVAQPAVSRRPYAGPYEAASRVRAHLQHGDRRRAGAVRRPATQALRQGRRATFPRPVEPCSR